MQKLGVWVWGKEGNLGPVGGGPPCKHAPGQPCGGEQCRPRAGTPNPTGLSSAQLSRHSRPLPIGYFCYGMCQPLGFSWGTGAQVTPSPHSAPPSVSGCIWGWAGRAPVGVQGPLAGTHRDTYMYALSAHPHSCVWICDICFWGSGNQDHLYAPRMYKT